MVLSRDGCTKAKPCSTIVAGAKPGSLAICQAACCSPEPTTNGDTRVQITQPFGFGSPAATLCGNVAAWLYAVACALITNGEVSPAASAAGISLTWPI